LHVSTTYGWLLRSASHLRCTDVTKRRRDPTCVLATLNSPSFLFHLQVIGYSSAWSAAETGRWDGPSVPRSSTRRMRIEGRDAACTRKELIHSAVAGLVFWVYLGLFVARCIFVPVENKKCTEYIWCQQE